MRGCSPTRSRHVRCAPLLIAVLIAATSGAFLSATVVKAAEPLRTETIDRLVQPYLDQKIAVGMVVGAIRGDTKLVRGYGRVTKSQEAKPSGRTVYEIGSISKTFTGLLLADAVIAGHVQLAQPVAELLSEDTEMPRHADGPIRLVDLATHASGLPRMPNNLSPSDTLDPYADYRAEDLYAFLEGHELRRGPRVEQEYSNLAFGLLGQVLADRAETSYGELVRTRIAEPLGMEETAIDLAAPLRARLAPPYDAQQTEVRNWRFQSMAGAGAIRSTVDDVLRYAQAHIDPPPGELGEAIELAWRIHQPPLDENDFAMGLGWHVARDGETRWHNGQTGGYHSMLLINRPAKVAVVVLANTATMEIDLLAEQLTRMLLGVPEQPREFD